MKNYSALILLYILLVGFAFADLTCTGDTTPNLGTTLKLNCTTQPSQSRCYAEVSDNSTIPIILGEYPSSCFGEDRVCINTFDDGSFIANIFINDKIFNTRDNYTALVKCFDPADNSTNETTFNFTPANYASPNWVAEVGVWATNNAIYIIIGVIAIAGFVLGYAYLFRG